MRTIDFLNVLFDDGQVTCFTETAKGTQIRPMAQADEFFCINALHPSKDSNPTEEYHDEAKARRADLNVVCFRNFLLEIDDMKLEEQIEYIKSKVPVTSIVYSGGKSYHFIISLEIPLNNLEEYKEVAQRLHLLVDKADKATKNPSRLSRLPGAVRKDTSKVQNLVYLGKRINNSELMALLPVINHFDKYTEKSVVFLRADLIADIGSPDKAMRRLGLSGRNALFHYFGNRLSDVGIKGSDRRYWIDLAYSNLESTVNFSINEAYLAGRVK